MLDRLFLLRTVMSLRVNRVSINIKYHPLINVPYHLVKYKQREHRKVSFYNLNHH